MSFRTWVTIITFILLALLVFFGRDQIIKAWQLLGSVNLWVWALLIPVQLLSYYATGEIMFSYLRSRGNLETTTRMEMTKIALELNFVNHILPSGGAAGFSYLGWVLHHHRVGASRATMAQIIRFLLTFLAFVLILLLAVVSLVFDHKIDKSIVIVSSLLVLLAGGGTVLVVYVVGSNKRLIKLANWITRIGNKMVSFFTGGKKNRVLKLDRIEAFFNELHQDYLEIRREKKILVRPFGWAIAVIVFDVALLFISFLSLGFFVNPAMLCIAFGISSITSVVSASPGGAGVYEAVMIAFLASAGVEADVAIAGTLLARVTLLVGTIVFGYIFYQLRINKYGNIKTT